LPPRTETNLYVDLSDAERNAYDEMRLAAVGDLDGIAGAPDTDDQRFRVLALLTRLRQLACHVGLVDSDWKGQSAKLEVLLDTLKELKTEGHRTLVFSQFTQYLALIRQTLDEHEISYEYLDGKTTPKARQERVDRFQQGDADAFLISLKAGGTGLNLTAADYVIHMDPWWNPAVESQATDRAHRIGQTKPVIVYRIVARGTIEEQILDLHSEKRDLVDGIMTGTKAAAKLSTKDLIALIRDVGR
jgi:SNF2 family DNA or RNA helicase